MLKKSSSRKKVEAEAKVEQTRTYSTLYLNLDLNLLHSLRPCPR